MARQRIVRPGSAGLSAEAPTHRTSGSGYSACSHPPLRHAGIEPPEQGPPLAHVFRSGDRIEARYRPAFTRSSPRSPPPHSKSGLLSCFRAIFGASMSHSGGTTMPQAGRAKEARQLARHITTLKSVVSGPSVVSDIGRIARLRCDSPTHVLIRCAKVRRDTCRTAARSLRR